MAPRRPAGIDSSEMRYRVDSFAAGIWPTLGICAISLVYLGVTWHRPHRPLTAGLFAIALIAVVVIAVLPRERIVLSRWREPFFALWSLFDIALIAGVAATDGGATSPFAALFFFPVVFAAMSYPLVSTLIVALAALVSHLALGLFAGPGEHAYLLVEAGCLAFGCLMVTLQGRSNGRQRESLEALALTDPLTGLLNHRAFQERLGAELARAERERGSVSVVALDVDSFKQINDERGHAAGDLALAVLAEKIRSALRPGDVCGRVGGDEFMLALAGADSRRAEGIVARLRDDIAAEGLTVSAGIAEYPRHALDKAELMRLADGAMYWAKKRGRDRQFVYSPGQDVALSAEEDAAIARRDGLVNTVHALARSVDTKDGYTHLHSRRVADYAAMLAERLGVPEERVNMIRTAGVLHDVGKIGVPDAILLKPGRLTPEEFSEMKRHSRLGQEIIAGAGMAEIADWVCHLHERFDGHGYPDGLAGEAIPLESRILAVTDALEEITSPRVYRQRRSVDEALIELELSAGSQFDPRVVTELVKLVADGELVVDPSEAAGPAGAPVGTGT